MRASLERVAALRDQLALNFESANSTEFQLAATSGANGICRIRLELLAATGFASDQTGTTESSSTAPREVFFFCCCCFAVVLSLTLLCVLCPFRCSVFATNGI